VLLAPHHGSRQSDPPGFAAWSSPEWVVISGSGRADVASVVETYEAAGARVVRTGLSGAVRFSIDHGAVSMESLAEVE
jgi:competence protein ComEC